MRALIKRTSMQDAAIYLRILFKVPSTMWIRDSIQVCNLHVGGFCKHVKDFVVNVKVRYVCVEP
jgi:hypothetical protein